MKAGGKPALPEGYVVPEVWNFAPQGGAMGAMNRPDAGPRSDATLPVGEHGYQVFRNQRWAARKSAQRQRAPIWRCQALWPFFPKWRRERSRAAGPPALGARTGPHTLVLIFFRFYFCPALLARYAKRHQSDGTP